MMRQLLQELSHLGLHYLQDRGFTVLYQLVLFLYVLKAGSCSSPSSSCASPIIQTCYFCKIPDGEVDSTVTVASAGDCEAYMNSNPSYETATYVKSTGSCKLRYSSNKLSYTWEEQVTFRRTCKTGCSSYALNDSGSRRVTASVSHSRSIDAEECVAECADTTNCEMAHHKYSFFSGHQCGLFTTCGTGCSTSSSFSYSTYRLYCYSTTDCGLDTTVVSNGYLLYSDGLTSQGSSVAYSCHIGYDPANTNTHTCLASGSWTTETFTCNVADCGTPASITNGQTAYSTTTYGSTAVHTCDTEYKMYRDGWFSSAQAVSGDQDTVSCQDTSSGSAYWDSTSVYCHYLDCNSPPTPADTTVAYTTTTYLSTAVYSCGTGYDLYVSSAITSSPYTRTCMGANSKVAYWDGSDAMCNAVDCGSPSNPTNGIAVYSSTTYGEQASFQCNTGYDVSSVETITCDSNGQWIGTYPTCTIRDCGSLDAPSDGSVSVPVTTYGQQATYSCNTGFNLVGASARTCQSNGTWSDSEPTCDIVDCGTLTTIADGTVNITATTYNNQATYACDTGYELSGSTLRTCSSTGTWNGTEPSCNAVDCGPLSSPANGVVTVGSTTYNNQATYACNDGYDLSGSSTRTCASVGSWDGSQPSCSEKDCGVPTSPFNGSVSAPFTTFNHQATYSCDTGFNLQGVSVLNCNSSGAWNDSVPTCEIIDCGSLTNISDGLITITSTTYDSFANYTCNLGYELSGSETRTCTSGGSWSGSTASCSIVSCGSLSNPTNGLVSGTGTDYGGVATYSCLTGYTLNGNSARECQANGSWSSVAPTCDIVDCGALTNPTSGIVSVGLTTYNSSAVYECILGYTRSGPDMRTCLVSGSWSDASPTCNIINCGSATAPLGGSVSSTSSFYNSTATYTCDAGYEMNGAAVRTCNLSGLWHPDEPVCTIVDCGSISDPPFGTVSTVRGTTFGEMAVYSCFGGYDLVGNLSRTCLSDQNWNGSEPVCEAIDCGPLASPTNGNVSTQDGTKYPNIANYSCILGYTVNGSPQRQCQSNGSWSDIDPTCIVTDCGSPSAPANGFATAMAGTTYNKIATYTCNTDYSLLGVPSRVCQSDGLWSDAQPSCTDPAAQDKNIYIAPCVCYENKTFTNMTQDEIIALLIAETAINLKNTTSARSRLECRGDPRASATTIGALAAGLLVIIGGLILAVDSIRVWNYFSQKDLYRVIDD